MVVFGCWNEATAARTEMLTTVDALVKKGRNHLTPVTERVTFGE